MSECTMMIPGNSNGLCYEMSSRCINGGRGKAPLGKTRYYSSTAPTNLLQVHRNLNSRVIQNRSSKGEPLNTAAVCQGLLPNKMASYLTGPPPFGGERFVNNTRGIGSRVVINGNADSNKQVQSNGYREAYHRPAASSSWASDAVRSGGGRVSDLQENFASTHGHSGVLQRKKSSDLGSSAVKRTSPLQGDYPGNNVSGCVQNVMNIPRQLDENRNNASNQAQACRKEGLHCYTPDGYSVQAKYPILCTSLCAPTNSINPEFYRQKTYTIPTTFLSSQLSNNLHKQKAFAPGQPFAASPNVRLSNYGITNSRMFSQEFGYDSGTWNCNINQLQTDKSATICYSQWHKPAVWKEMTTETKQDDLSNANSLLSQTQTASSEHILPVSVSNNASETEQQTEISTSQDSNKPTLHHAFMNSPSCESRKRKSSSDSSSADELTKRQSTISQESLLKEEKRMSAFIENYSLRAARLESEIKDETLTNEQIKLLVNSTDCSVGNLVSLRQAQAPVGVTAVNIQCSKANILNKDTLNPIVISDDECETEFDAGKKCKKDIVSEKIRSHSKDSSDTESCFDALAFTDTESKQDSDDEMTTLDDSEILTLLSAKNKVPVVDVVKCGQELIIKQHVTTPQDLIKGICLRKESGFGEQKQQRGMPDKTDISNQ